WSVLDTREEACNGRDDAGVVNVDAVEGHFDSDCVSLRGVGIVLFNVLENVVEEISVAVEVWEGREKVKKVQCKVFVSRKLVDSLVKDGQWDGSVEGRICLDVFHSQYVHCFVLLELFV